MTIEERTELLRRSIPEIPNLPDSRRYAFRRGSSLEWFVAVFTQSDGEASVFHGYPTVHVPAKVLRVLRDQGDISEVEYKRLVKELG